MNSMKEKSIRRDFFKYAIPSVISMWVFTIYTMVDGMFVAKGVGENALAAVNISMPLINVTFGLGILFAVGASTKASIAKGENDLEAASKIFTHSTVTVFVLACLFAVLAFLNLDDLARGLGSTPETHRYVMDYLSIIVLFIPFYMTAYNFEVLVKADGFPQKAVATMILGAMTNIILDYIFVIALSWGIQGAAIATGLSQFLAFIIFFSHFLSAKSSFRFVNIKWQLKESLALAKIGAADSLTEFSIASMIFMFNHVIVRFLGNDGLVIFTVIAYVFQLILMTMIGINQGMQPLVSFYYGKKEKSNYQYIFKIALTTATICSLIAFGLGIFFPRPVVALFIDSIQSPQLFTQAIRAFRLFSASYLPLGIVIILYGYFTALEKTKYAILISISRGWIFVAFSLTIMPMIFGETGVWLAMTLSESLALILAIYLYYRGFPKHNHVHS